MSRRLKISSISLLVLAAALGSLPWWLGSALQPILLARNITFERYEREGYAHFRLRNTTYQHDRVTVTVETLHAPTPVLWLAQWLGSGPSLHAENWSLRISPTPGPATPPSSAPSIHGPPDLLVSLRDRVWPRLVRWLPHARLKNGVLRGPGLDLTIADTAFDRGTLVLTDAHRGTFEFSLTAVPTGDGSFAFTGRSAAPEAELKFAWSGAEFKGGGTVWDQPVQLSAVFPAQGWLPAELRATSEHWSLPAARVKLGAPYVLVHGGARFDWRDGAFTLAVDAAADPAKDAKAPPFTAHAKAHGSLREITLETLDIDAPFATAKLSSPITLSRDRSLAAASAQLTVQADLAKQPWWNARGLVTGKVSVTGASVLARQAFDVEFHDLLLPGFALRSGRAEGNLQWPLLELKSLHVQLDENSRLDAHGLIDWQKREIREGTVKAVVDAASLKRWLPADLTWDRADVALTVDGPLDSPRHAGSLTIAQARWSPLKPVALTATWEGTGADITTASTRLVAGASVIDGTGSFTSAGLQIDTFEFTSAGQKIWSLATPARVQRSPTWQIESLQLTGPESSLQLTATGGPQAAFELAATSFDSRCLQDWVTLSGPSWRVQSLQSSGRILNGALVFDARVTAHIDTSARSADLKLVARGDADGLRLEELTLTEANRVLTQATGRFPVSWRLQPTPHWQLDESAPLEFVASSEADSPLWSTLTAATGVQLTHPSAKANLTGTLRQPRGDLQLRVDRLQFAPEKSRLSLPEVEDLAVDAHFDRSTATLRTFSAKLEGQAVSASGRIPMEHDAWRKLWQNPAGFDWTEAEGQLDIPDADLAALAQHAPGFVAALGRLHLHVALATGGKFSGELKIADASSRPLPPFGTFQEINADAVFADRTLTVRSLTARMGGEPVSVDGHITFKPGAPPQLALKLTGRRLPIVRMPELLIRTDLDLQANTDEAGVTHVTGQARPRDSLALANLNALLPSGPRGVNRAPPYFSVSAEPFRRWLLDVDVRGPKAVKIRTTIFNGTASAQFHLTGTLGEPRAVGDLSVDEGQVVFPFAAFRVQQGTVRLSQADPFHARINLVATAQRRDYQLRLEVTGQLPDPVITMSSTPALEATDVLLMVMTGRPPSGDTATSSTQRLALLGAYLGKGFIGDFGAGNEDRLEISSGEQITAAGRETYEVEYKLGARWSLVGEYDQFDSYNADMKRRIYIQESTPREKK